MGAKTRKLSQINDSLIEWQSVVVADGSTGLTAVAGRGYFINTTGGAITVTFPASPKIGDTIIINDYATTFATNNVTINFNGNKLEADTANAILSTNDQTHTFVFTDATQGWKIVNQDTGTSLQPSFISATGGTITTSGDFKIHTFTGDGCFVVSTIGNPRGGGAIVDYLVVAGGGSGQNSYGGGGAGGFRFYANTTNNPQTGPGAPLNNYPSGTALTLSTSTYPVTVGAGGTAAPGTSNTAGSPSIFSTITSAGGGKGGEYTSPSANQAGVPGGSGGGGGSFTGPGANPGGTGNTPPVSPPQGNNGGAGLHIACDVGGGGGGATAVGGNGAQPYQGGNGGAGAGITGFGTSGESSGGQYYFSGGGGGANPPGGAPGTAGLGGGGKGYNAGGTAATAGTANTGGGGGTNVAGGKGIVVIRYKFQ